MDKQKLVVRKFFMKLKLWSIVVTANHMVQAVTTGVNDRGNKGHDQMRQRTRITARSAC